MFRITLTSRGLKLRWEQQTLLLPVEFIDPLIDGLFKLKHAAVGTELQFAFPATATSNECSRDSTCNV